MARKLPTRGRHNGCLDKEILCLMIAAPYSGWRPTNSSPKCLSLLGRIVNPLALKARTGLGKRGSLIPEGESAVSPAAKRERWTHHDGKRQTLPHRGYP